MKRQLSIAGLSVMTIRWTAIDEVEATGTNNEIFIVPINVGQASGLPASDSQAGGLRYPKPISWVEPSLCACDPGSEFVSVGRGRRPGNS